MIKEVAERQKALKEESKRLDAADRLLDELVRTSDQYFVARFLKGAFEIKGLEPFMDREAGTIRRLLHDAEVLGLENIFTEPVHIPRASTGITLEINVPTYLQTLHRCFPK